VIYLSIYDIYFFQISGSGKRINPILEAKRKKEMGLSSTFTTPTASTDAKSGLGNRNPFKKTATPKDSPR
jgi:hypothetical protein